jgi:photosynthetic reaction center H subunit
MFRNFNQYIDVTQVLLYVFWGLFAWLIIYLHKEDKREGYPLINKDSSNIHGWPKSPGPKEFIPAHKDH